MVGETPPQTLGGRVRPGKVKSRLIEAHPPGHDRDGIADLLSEISEFSGTRVERLGDDLWGLLADRDVVFFDTLNERFWLLHTTATADVLSRFVTKELLGRPQLDSAWLPASQLSELEGERQWMNSSFFADDLVPTNGGQNGARRWRLQVEGFAPQDLLEVVRRELPRYAAATSLTAVGSRVVSPGVGDVQIVADYRGGFVSSGNSFDLVAGVLWRTLDRYETFVRSLENTHQLRTVAVGDLGLEISGEIATIYFPEPVGDLSAFVSGLFSCRAPFRLWAVPREVTSGEWEANAVDLHIGQTLRIEIRRDWMRVLLDAETCGNTLARLVANLQHRYHAQTTLSPVAA